MLWEWMLQQMKTKHRIAQSTWSSLMERLLEIGFVMLPSRSSSTFADACRSILKDEVRGIE